MTPKLAEYIEARKALDADERAIAALAFVSGKVTPVSGRETRAMGRALLAQRRT